MSSDNVLNFCFLENDVVLHNSSTFQSLRVECFYNGGSYCLLFLPPAAKVFLPFIAAGFYKLNATLEGGSHSSAISKRWFWRGGQEQSAFLENLSFRYLRALEGAYEKKTPLCNLFSGVDYTKNKDVINAIARCNSAFGEVSLSSVFDAALSSESENDAIKVFCKLVETIGVVCSSSLIESFLAIYRGLHGMSMPQKGASLIEKKHPVFKVFLGSYSRSGVGAVRDYLKDHNNVFMVPGNELQILTGVNGALNLVKPDNEERDLFLAMADFLKVHVLGIPNDITGKEIKIGRLARKEIVRSNVVISSLNQEIFHSSVRNFFYRLVSPELQCEALKVFVDEFVSSLKAYREGSIPVFVNAINTDDVSAVLLLDNFHYLAVKRDARDQYVTAKETNNPELDVVYFVERYESRYANVCSCEEELKRLSVSGSVIHVQFERFVIDELVRKNISGLIGAGYQGENFFNPSVSNKNVGFHFGFKSKYDNEVSYIEKCLPHLVFSELAEA